MKLFEYLVLHCVVVVVSVIICVLAPTFASDMPPLAFLCFVVVCEAVFWPFEGWICPVRVHVGIQKHANPFLFNTQLLAAVARERWIYFHCERIPAAIFPNHLVQQPIELWLIVVVAVAFVVRLSGVEIGRRADVNEMQCWVVAGNGVNNGVREVRHCFL